MKLLYVWIEKFRNIIRQGLVVDNEYIISVDSPEENIEYLDNENRSVYFKGDPPQIFRKIYDCKLNFKKNEQYTGNLKKLPIQSITALVGKNASGKTSIIECLHTRTDQLHYRNDEQRYYFLVFLDEINRSIVVRTRDIWLVGKGTRKRDLRLKEGYEEYIISLDNNVNQPPKCSDIANMISVYQHRQQETGWEYSVLGLPTMPINLDRSNSRNAFKGVFDFLCSFPKLGGEDNSIVFYLQDKDSREKAEYFEKEKMTSSEYKCYFIYKVANLLFGKLRDFLNHEKPQYVLSGRIRRPDEDAIKEDMECAEVLSFCRLDFSRSDSTSLVITKMESQPKDRILQAISFFRKSTYVNNDYLDELEKLFNCLYDVKAEFFTALYKLEIPFKKEFENIIVAFRNCLALDYNGKNWCESIAVDFEWFSAGEYQLAIMFSGLYQCLTEHEFNNSNLILLFDEPEMHMHPETGRHFIENLERALTAFKERGLINSCQIIFATHSPFIIQSLKKYNHFISLVNKKYSQIQVNSFDHLPLLKLPNRQAYSFNLVMYKIFDIPTVELHIELYGYLQEKFCDKTVAGCDRKIAESAYYIPGIHDKPSKYKSTSYKTLPTFIRNAIDHPGPSKTYSDEEFVCSIELLIEICNH